MNTVLLKDVNIPIVNKTQHQYHRTVKVNFLMKNSTLITIILCKA